MEGVSFFLKGGRWLDAGEVWLLKHRGLRLKHEMGSQG